MIEYNWPDDLTAALAEFFDAREPKAFYLTHYELAKLEGAPSNNAQDWKEFLTIPAVSDYINQELRLLQQAEMRKMLQDISKNAKSVGTAQNLTALMKVMGAEGTKEGPAFIYCYVPLNDQEQQAPNVKVLPEDPFRREV